MIPAALAAWGFVKGLAKSRAFWIVLAVLLVLLVIWRGLDAYGDARFSAGQRDQKTADQSALDQAAANVSTANANWASCRVAAASQSLLVEQRAAEDAAQLKASTKAVADADAKTKAMAAQLAQVVKPLTGVDQCARVIEVDQRLMDALK